GGGVGLRVELLMRMAVTAEKIGEPQDVAAPGAADDHRSARARLEQTDATQDERAHHSLAELRFRDQQGTQPVGPDEQRLDRTARANIDQARPPAQMRELAREASGAERVDDLALVARSVLDDVGAAGQDDVQS